LCVKGGDQSESWHDDTPISETTSKKEVNSPRPESTFAADDMVLDDGERCAHG